MEIKMIKYQRRQSSSYAWWAQRATLGYTDWNKIQSQKYQRPKAETRQSQHRCSHALAKHPQIRLLPGSRPERSILVTYRYLLRTPSESKVSRGDTPPGTVTSHGTVNLGPNYHQLPLAQEYHRMTAIDCLLDVLFFFFLFFYYFRYFRQTKKAVLRCLIRIASQARS